MEQPVRFGKYTLLDRISVGGMAEVFRARTADGKLHALKRILPSLAEDHGFIKMFVQEARISGGLHHPNICRIYEFGRCDGAHFIAMEYIWGKDLTQIRNRLRKLRLPMPLEMTCAILRKALDGLDYAHKKRDAFSRALDVVHRDCSPHNLVVGYDGEVKVIDFGIAKAKSSVVRTVGQLKGKFAYMSPEQTTGKPIDRRSDIFALGIVLYELVTGERLFVGDSDFAVLERVRTVDIKPVRELVPDLPDELEAVIGKALARDREQRYQWCSEMRADLGAIAAASTEALSAWMRDLFADDIANEREDLGLAQDQITLSPVAAPAQPPRRSGSLPMMSLPELDSGPVLDLQPAAAGSSGGASADDEPEIEIIDLDAPPPDEYFDDFADFAAEADHSHDDAATRLVPMPVPHLPPMRSQLPPLDLDDPDPDAPRTVPPWARGSRR